jgi:hypothetical protein
MRWFKKNNLVFDKNRADELPNYLEEFKPKLQEGKLRNL